MDVLIKREKNPALNIVGACLFCLSFLMWVILIVENGIYFNAGVGCVAAILFALGLFLNNAILQSIGNLAYIAISINCISLYNDSAESWYELREDAFDLWYSCTKSNYLSSVRDSAYDLYSTYRDLYDEAIQCRNASIVLLIAFIILLISIIISEKSPAKPVFSIFAAIVTFAALIFVCVGFVDYVLVAFISVLVGIILSRIPFFKKKTTAQSFAGDGTAGAYTGPSYSNTANTAFGSSNQNTASANTYVPNNSNTQNTWTNSNASVQARQVPQVNMILAADRIERVYNLYLNEILSRDEYEKLKDNIIKESLKW